MEPRRKKEILDSLKNWKDRPFDIIKPFEVVFPEHSGFKFKCFCPDDVGLDFNVYMGLSLNGEEKQEIWAHLVPEYEDISDYAFNMVLSRPAEPYKNLAQIPIDKIEALQRIDNWEKHASTWMLDQDSLFLAISVPTSDFEKGYNSFYVYFALKENAENQFDFDLILYNTKQGLYLDTVRLIPPFKVDSNYYIATLIPNEVILF